MRQLAIVLGLGLALVIGCSSDNSDADAGSEQTALQDSLDRVAVDEDLLRTASARLITEFQGSLQARLMAAMKGSGPIGAIGECNTAAPLIADSMSRAGWTIKRVTDQYRNPDNRATTAEKSIMAIFSDTVKPKRRFFGDWSTEDSLTHYTYYKPIYIKNLCTKCHGDLQTLAPGVYNEVKKHYPNDQATGYKEGDLRGMFVVQAAWPEGRDFAVKLLAGHAFDEDSTAVMADSSETVPQ